MSNPAIFYPEIGAPDPSVSHTNAPDGSTGTAGPWVLGQTLGGYIFAVAGSTITAGQAVVINQLGSAVPVTTTNSYNGQIAVANCAVATGAYAFFQFRGIPASGVNTLTGATANTAVYTSATAGALTTSTGGTLLHGIVLTAANSSGSTAATACFCSGIDV